jgi:hypothetical protein
MDVYEEFSFWSVKAYSLGQPSVDSHDREENA